MKIAILGTRGIPNQYGGFEQFAEYVSVGLAKKGHSVTVYNPHFHDFQEKVYHDVEIIHQYSPEDKLGASANFIYDYLCLKDALRKDFDVILECGYQSVAISYFITPIQESLIVTNMDGMEWKRAKWSVFVKKLTKKFEEWGAKKSHALVSDNEGIQNYLLDEYGVNSTMIPYGAEIFTEPKVEALSEYCVTENKYFLLIARLEPENNIEMILDGYVASQSAIPFQVVGNHRSSYGEVLKKKYRQTGINFLGGIYDQNMINNLRYYSRAYFHGHSVGGTNPSLLEAMACSCFIIAHDNEFNRSVLKENGLFFSSEEVVTEHIKKLNENSERKNIFIDDNLEQIRTVYSWDTIVNQYEDLFKELIADR
ncbi:DUF1972 domain-containing protein [Gracilimonas sp.]|uniref:DUF1972 domain-containing protein n=1 Tax=Gracilimonas sp. TaxID=1974203 RepID=UPI003BAB76BD